MARGIGGGAPGSAQSRERKIGIGSLKTVEPMEDSAPRGSGGWGLAAAKAANILVVQIERRLYSAGGRVYTATGKVYKRRGPGRGETEWTAGV